MRLCTSLESTNNTINMQWKVEGYVLYNTCKRVMSTCTCGTLSNTCKRVLSTCTCGTLSNTVSTIHYMCTHTPHVCIANIIISFHYRADHFQT